MDVMDTTTMATACGWSFLEAEDVEVVVAEEEVAEWEEPPGEDTDPLHGARSTGLLCQVGVLISVFFLSTVQFCVSPLSMQILFSLFLPLCWVRVCDTVNRV